MKKKLSLLVALLMVLTLIPLNAFAVKTSFNAKNTVGPDDKAPVSIDLEVQKSDRVSTGLVTVVLGEDAEFIKDTVSVTIGTNNLDNKLKVSPNKEYLSIDVDDSVKAMLTTGASLVIKGDVQFDGAAAGDHKWVVDASDIGLGKYERAYATVKGDDGKFTRKLRTSVEVVGRGNEKQLSTVEIEVKEIGDYIEIRLPSDDYEWSNNTIIDRGTELAKDGRSLFIKADKKKVLVTPVLEVLKNASTGDIELDITRAKGYDNNKKKLTGEQETESVVLGEYKEYGLTLKTVKDVKEVLVNGEKYTVDVELKSDDKNGLAEYYDFTVDGGDVWITGAVSEYMKGDKEPKSEDNAKDEFTFTGIGRNVNKIKFTVNVKPDWDAKGEIVLKAKSKHREEAECVVLKLKPVLEMKVEAKEILAGERVIAVNDVVLEETEARALKPGQRFGITLSDMKFDLAKFENKGTIEAEGIKVKDLKVDDYDQTIYFTVDSRSKKDAPAKIVLKDLKVVTTRSLPLGNYKLVLVAVADKEVAKDKDPKLVAKIKKDLFELFKVNEADFFKAVSELGRVKKTTVFTLGSADYTVDGVAMKLDSPVFTQDNYTMLPVRAIADALGVEVVWNQENKTATFIDGDKVVSITVNAKVLYKNGIAYPMTTKSSVKAERMFISISSVGDAFGLNRNVDYIYNDAAKTVTIYPDAAKKVVEEAK